MNMNNPTHAAAPREPDTTIESLGGGGPRVTAVPLPRRAVLRGAGVALALPWLEAMAAGAPAGSEVVAAPRRLVYVYVPNGVATRDWRARPNPSEGGGEPELGSEAAAVRPIGPLPKLLDGLAPWADRLQLFRGLTADKARANGDGAGDHARAAAAYLTGVQPLKTRGQVRVGESADQLAARKVGGATRIRSLNLGTERGQQSGQCDSSYACVYSSNISWSSPTIPVGKEIDPRRAFDALFRGGDGAMDELARHERVAGRRSLLDFVRGESERLNRRLGVEDRRRVEAFSDGLRELERQLSFDDAAHTPGAPESARPDPGRGSYRHHMDIQFEVLALALQTDVTRIATFMLANEGSNRRYGEIGVKEGHHSLSHHGGDEEKLRDIAKINRMHLDGFGRFLARLDATSEAEGSVLDASMVVYGSGIAEGNRHDHHDLPVLLAGGRAAGLRPGHERVWPKNTPLNDLHLALLARMGVVGERLGDGRGPLGEI